MTPSFLLPDGSLQPGNLPECGAAVTCHGDGRLGELEGFAALSLPAHEDGWRDELWLPLSSPYGPGTSVFGRRKVNGCVFLFPPRKFF